jgi:hypothetical protein
MMMMQQQQQYAQQQQQYPQMPGQQMTGQSFPGPDPYAQQAPPYNPAGNPGSVSSAAVAQPPPGVPGTRVGEASTPMLNDKTIAIGGARCPALAASAGAACRS